jgi:excisionase family DNA binding protein
MTQRLLTPRRFAQIFSLKERTVRQWIADSRVEVIKVGSSVRIPIAEVDRLIREGRRPAGQNDREVGRSANTSSE